MLDLEGPLRTAVEHAARRRPGVAAGLLAPDRSTAVASAGRVALPDGERPGPGTLFEIGSITKVFTALLLADATVRGDVTLDTPVEELLGRPAPRRGGRPITLADLSTHRAGLPRSPVGRWAEVRAGLVTHVNPYADVTTEALLQALDATHLQRTPGTGRMRYSNFGAALLGEALAQAAGTTYAALVTERVCRPLGLQDTAVHLDDDQQRRFAQGHRAGNRPAPAWDLPGMAGAGALKSTVPDLLRFLDANLHPDEHQLGDAMRLTHTRRWGSRLGIGLGWIVLTGRGGELHWHNGGTGGFRSFAGFDRGGWGVVVLTNSHRGVDKVALRLLQDLGADVR